jgi:hypothetical protein
VTPEFPHWVAEVAVTQVVPAQQPMQFAGPQVVPVPHWPPLHEPEPHEVHAAPLAPHAVGWLPGWQVLLPSMQPVQVAAAQVPLAPQVAPPWHVAQAPPALPQAEVLLPAWQVPPESQQPWQFVELQVPVLPPPVAAPPPVVDPPPVAEPPPVPVPEQVVRWQVSPGLHERQRMPPMPHSAGVEPG